jgi:hypothetical protein
MKALLRHEERGLGSYPVLSPLGYNLRKEVRDNALQDH